VVPPAAHWSTPRGRAAARGSIRPRSAPAGPWPSRAVQADAAGDRRQPGAWRSDGVLLRPGHRVPAGVGLLHGALGLGQGIQQPVGQIDQPAPLAHDRAQARIGRPPAGPARVVTVLPFVGRICPHQFDETAHRNVRLARLPDIPTGCVVVLVRRIRHPENRNLRGMMTSSSLTAPKWCRAASVSHPGSPVTSTRPAHCSWRGRSSPPTAPSSRSRAGLKQRRQSSHVAFALSRHGSPRAGEMPPRPSDLHQHTKEAGR
jgi:hypothetical protein